MRLFGLPIPFTGKAASPVASPVAGHGGWFPLIREPFPGAWQRNISIDRNTVMANPTVFACQTLIASDISKLRVKLVQRDGQGVWSEVANPAYDPVLRKPNHFQTRNQFWETWILSKLVFGNAYVLKHRDERKVVTALYVLNPLRVTPLVADDGSVFYQLSDDSLAGVGESVMVPAREMIHDRFNCVFHPMVGMSPIFASGLAATQGANIQVQSVRLFENNSQPGGMLTAPGKISNETAERLKANWEQNFTGKNVGRVAVLGDGLKYERMAFTAVEGQLIEQLKWSDEKICSTYHVPPYKVGVGPMPTYNNIQTLNLEYYSQCLQKLIEDAETCLDEGLGMASGMGTEFDVDNLLRMDSMTQYEVLEKAKSVLTLDERRKKVDVKALPTGGGTVYLQQQDHSIEAIAARDKLLIEQANAPAADQAPANDNAEAAAAAAAKDALIELYKGLG